MQKTNSPYLLVLCLLFFCSCVSNNSTNTVRLGNGQTTINYSGVEDLYRFLTYSEHRVPLVSAHRGGPDVNYPENALETLQRVAYKIVASYDCAIDPA